MVGGESEKNFFFSLCSYLIVNCGNQETKQKKKICGADSPTLHIGNWSYPGVDEEKKGKLIRIHHQ